MRWPKHKPLNYVQLSRIGTWVISTLIALMVLGTVLYVAALGLHFAGDSLPFHPHRP